MGDMTTPLPDVAALRRQIEVLQIAVDALPFPMFWKDRELIYLGGNQTFAMQSGAGSPADVPGRTDYDLAWKPEEAEAFRADDHQVITSEKAKLRFIEPVRLSDGSERWVETNKVPLRGASGQVIGVVGWYVDITERKLEEEAQARRREAMIREQAEDLMALATPLLPVADGVLVMPLIGRIDQARAQQVMETLLAGVAQHRARAAILDVTGVQRIDSSVVSALVAAAQAVRLLGAEAIVTGIQPAMAQVMVASAGDLRNLLVLNDLKAGVARALGR